MRKKDLCSALIGKEREKQVNQRFEFVFQSDYTERDIRERPESIARDLNQITSSPEWRTVRFVMVRAK